MSKFIINQTNQLNLWKVQVSWVEKAHLVDDGALLFLLRLRDQVEVFGARVDPLVDARAGQTLQLKDDLLGGFGLRKYNKHLVY